MKYLRFDLTLRSPAIVSTLVAGSNGTVTQPFIPGSTIRGAIAARLIAAKEDPKGELFRRLILSGAVRYLHAYPQLNAVRTLPVPLSWKCRKEDSSRAHDLGAYSGTFDEGVDGEEFDQAWPQDAMVSVAGAFVAPTVASGSRALAPVQIDARLHQQRDRVKGRPWKDHKDQAHGAIFAYEYLEPNQLFTGVIQFTDEALMDDVERMKRSLAKPILVGRSRRAGYGGEAFVSNFADAAEEYAGATGRLNADIAAEEAFRVLLTSAYVGRHPLTGQVDPSAIENELAAALGGRVKVERRRWSFETLGGFNRKWGLETPQVLALRAGSVLVVSATEPIELEVLRRVEHDGLGERRAEGLGRVLFLAHSDDHGEVRFPTDNASQSKATVDFCADHLNPRGASGAVPGKTVEGVEFLEKRIILEAARAELDRVARLDIASQSQKIPPGSLLSRLRGPLRAAVDAESATRCLQTIATWCGQGNNAFQDAARAKLNSCTIADAQSLHTWLTNVASASPNMTGWTKLVEATGSQSSVIALATCHHLTTEKEAQRILNENSTQLRVYLIEAVLAALALKNRDQS